MSGKDNFPRRLFTSDEKKRRKKKENKRVSFECEWVIKEKKVKWQFRHKRSIKLNVTRNSQVFLSLSRSLFVSSI